MTCQEIKIKNIYSRLISIYNKLSNKIKISNTKNKTIRKIDQ